MDNLDIAKRIFSLAVKHLPAGTKMDDMQSFKNDLADLVQDATVKKTLHEQQVREAALRIYCARVAASPKDAFYTTNGVVVNIEACYIEARHVLEFKL